MAVELERVIPLPQAAKQMGMTVEALTHLVTSGKLEAVQLPGGEIAVSERAAKQQVRPIERDERLRGVGITVTEAATKYKVPRNNILAWVARGYITVIEPGYKMSLDESDVKLCVGISAQHKSVGSRAPLFDENGQPYQLSESVMASYRRGLRQTQKAQAKSSIRSRNTVPA
jgi:hypothetical protein